MLTFTEIFIIGIVIPNILQFSNCFRYLIQFKNFVLQSNAFINDFPLTYQIASESNSNMHYFALAQPGFFFKMNIEDE